MGLIAQETMKRHFRDNQGRLLQVDKTWKNLRTKQQELIAHELRTRYLTAYDETGKLPSKKECEAIVYEVLDLIEARNIWIPAREVFAYMNKHKTRWLNKHLKRRAELGEGDSTTNAVPVEPDALKRIGAMKGAWDDFDYESFQALDDEVADLMNATALPEASD